MCDELPDEPPPDRRGVPPLRLSGGQGSDLRVLKHARVLNTGFSEIHNSELIGFSRLQSGARLPSSPSRRRLVVKHQNNYSGFKRRPRFPRRRRRTAPGISPGFNSKNNVFISLSRRFHYSGSAVLWVVFRDSAPLAWIPSKSV